MKLLSKIILLTSALPVVVYHGYFFMLPSVTVVNNSGERLRAVVTLPVSNLDFGEIEAGEDNQIYYEVSQPDGDYQYQFTIGDDAGVDAGVDAEGNTGRREQKIQGRCGYVTHSQYHQRVKIIVNQQLEVSCQLN